MTIGRKLDNGLRIIRHKLKLYMPLVFIAVGYLIGFTTAIILIR